MNREVMQQALDDIQSVMAMAFHERYAECCGRGSGGECCGSPVEAWPDWARNVMDGLADSQRALSAELAKPAAVQNGWRSAKGGGDWPKIGKKYLICIGTDLVLQHEVYEFDRGDEDFGFWTRDGIDDCEFDPEKDLWIPLEDVEAMLAAAPQPPAVTSRSPNQEWSRIDRMFITAYEAGMRDEPFNFIKARKELIDVISNGDEK